MVEKEKVVVGSSLNKNHYAGAGVVLIQDSALSVAASLFAILLVRWIAAPVVGYTTLVLAWLGFALVGTIIGSLISGSHKVVHRWATVVSASRLVVTVAIKEVFMIAYLLLAFHKFYPSTPLAVVAVLCDTLMTGVLLFYVRFAARIFASREQHSIKDTIKMQNVLVGGVSRESVEKARALESTGKYNVLGFISTDRKLSGRILGEKVVYVATDAKELEALEWRLGGIDCVMLPKSGNLDNNEIKKIAEDPSQAVVEGDAMNGFGKFIKRSFDIVVSGVLILIFSPLALLCAIAVKAEDGGPILYKQERIGKNGIPFNILKFRSMRTDAEVDGAHLYSGDDDPRLTKVGHFLRSHHLDELPQLINVFRGDMSFIGYRPERQYYINQIMDCNPRYRYLYQIRPGVTSYATLYNGYTDTLEKMLTRLDLDLYYLRNHSVWFDIKVLGLTFLNIVSGKTF